MLIILQFRVKIKLSSVGLRMKMESPLKIYEHPRLKEPYLVIGWEDTGHVGTGVADYLIDKLGAEEFGEIEPYDFSYLPNAVVKGGVLEDI